MDTDMYQQKVTEATLNRVLRHLGPGDTFVILTASRQGLRRTQAEERNRQLVRMILTDLHLPFMQIGTSYALAVPGAPEVWEETFFAFGTDTEDLAIIMKQRFKQRSILAGQVGIGLWLLCPNDSKQQLAHEATGPALLEAWASWISHNQMDGGEVRLEYLAYRPSTMAESIYWAHLLERQGINQAMRDKFDRYVV